MKTLAAAGVVVGCGAGSGYGVVDPMPPPACFENPLPIVTVRFVEGGIDAGASGADGSRLVEIVVKFQQTDAKVNALSANLASGPSLDILEQQINARDFRAVFRVPRDAELVYFSAKVECAQGRGFDVSLALDATTVKVVSVR